MPTSQKQPPDLSRVVPRRFAGGVVGLIAAVLVCEAAGVAGVLVTDTGRSPWYRELKKPSFAPPPSVFGPVWTTLYVLMGVALFAVWRKRRTVPAARPALVLFFVQLLLNAVWTPVFFGAKSIGAALAVLVVLWAAIVATVAKFRRVSLVATLLMIPYLLWCSFAVVLNAEFFRLNGHSSPPVPSSPSAAPADRGATTDPSIA